MAEIFNERLLYPSYEIIGGKKFIAPALNPTHGGVIMRLGMVIGSHLDADDSGYVFSDNTDVHFPDGTLLKPDLSVVLEKNSAIIDWFRGIYGVPDMVVEGDNDKYIGYEHIGENYSGNRKYLIEDKDLSVAKEIAKLTKNGI